jgi:DNA-directed RNA polymerase, mitochondrial
MTRDEKTADLVNVVAHREAKDFYGDVASQTYEANPEIRNLMEGPDDREIVKQPVMSYFYGSRPGGFQKLKNGRWQPFGMTKQVIDVLKERGQSTEATWKLAQKLARTIYRVVEGTAPSATAVRDFLEQLVKLCTDNNEPLCWTTPLGLPVINRYHKPETERVYVSLNGYRPPHEASDRGQS